MQTHADCLTCFLKQAHFAAQRVSDDPELVFRAVRYAATIALPQAEMARAPAENATTVMRAVSGFLGVRDPYESDKRRYNALALDVYDALRDYIRQSPDRLAAALKVAALGNVLDLNILNHVDMTQVIAQVESLAWDTAHYALLRRDIKEAQRILVLGDNAGEIVFDRLLVEALPPGIVSYAVKSGPVANDVLRADAEQVGMDAVARVIETGSDYFGTPLARCSPAFRAEFNAADVIIAKGMANLETLSDVAANIYFVLKIKCAYMASYLGMHNGDLVLLAQHVRLDAE